MRTRSNKRVAMMMRLLKILLLRLLLRLLKLSMILKKPRMKKL